MRIMMIGGIDGRLLLLLLRGRRRCTGRGNIVHVATTTVQHQHGLATTTTIATGARQLGLAMTVQRDRVQLDAGNGQWREATRR